MGTKKTGLTREQHEQLGLELQTIRDRMQIIGSDLTANYNQKDKVAGIAHKISDDLEKLRHQLEELLFKEHPESTTETYYRATRDDFIRDPAPIRPYPQE